MVQNMSEFDTLREALVAAAETAATNFGRPVTGILYTQAGRNFVSTALPARMVVSMARRDSTARKDDPREHRNRPLDHSHVREIATYLREQQVYLLPPIVLNASHKLPMFVQRTQTSTKPCAFVLPPDEYLYITDGQHRIEALKQALLHRPEMERDAIGVTIIEESDLDQVHQDFFDAAQVMPLAKSLLVEYDGREPLNWLTRDLIASVSILAGRVEKIGRTVGKNSLMLFTSNQVKQGVLQLLVGDWTLYAGAMNRQAEQILAPAKDLWAQRLRAFLEAFTKHNTQWSQVTRAPLSEGSVLDVPHLRERYLHFSGAGLLVIGGVGHAILDKPGSTDGHLSSEQEAQVAALADLDWTRTGALWQGNVVGPQGNITPHKNNVALAVAKVKIHLGLPITPKERESMQARREAELARAL